MSSRILLGGLRKPHVPFKGVLERGYRYRYGYTVDSTTLEHVLGTIYAGVPSSRAWGTVIFQLYGFYSTRLYIRSFDRAAYGACEPEGPFKWHMSIVENYGRQLVEHPSRRSSSWFHATGAV